jgi:hypothetical protein
MSPPKPKKNIEKQSVPKNNYEANDASEEMNISTYPPNGGADSSAAAP